MRVATSKGKGATRVAVSLSCTECSARNYKTTKKREAKLELKKFCKACGKHTLHRDSK
jgi:large subunit ribosomal protein L33